jgi:hypothetical protein
MREKEILTAIIESYAPYHQIDAFGEGFEAYQSGCYHNPYDGQHGVNARAWDRGL